MSDFSISDRRGHTRTASGIYVGNANTEMRRLRQAGYTLPNSPVQARVEARRVADTATAGSLADSTNKAIAAQMRRSRMGSMRGSTTGGSTMLRTGSNTQMAMPKIRQPMSSLADKGVPFNVQDPKELIELRRWCRLFYSTHDLVPLLIDIYSKFPVVGLEFQSKDPKIQEFYEQMFMQDLNYAEFLPDGLGREYFTVGEVTSLAHFNESLGIWSSEEILNPDMVRVSKSLFVGQERVQLLVKDLVESLRSGPQGSTTGEESPSEKLERTWEYQQLVKHYPEIVKAAAQDDGLDISDALCSRLVNKASWWDLRGTPHLLRSFRTLMMEESLHAAQDAVADRLYAPLILATMGIENMGDGEPWIPDQGELDDLRDDMQNALAADFKLLVHNFGVNIQSVFGREQVPRFDTDYDRIDAKLLQAWGIGQALIAGGSGAGGAYASSALNREVCEQLMLTFQNKVHRHIMKRAEVIAEAQEHYDFELKGGIRRPIYREIVQYNEETGEEEIVRVPKLLLPEVKFACVVPGTQVLTPTGQRNVEDIQPGDEVIAWDGAGYVIDTALHTGLEHRDALVEVTTKTGRSIRCTADHRFWTEQGWVEAADLTSSHAIRTSAGQLAARTESDDDLDMLRFIGLLVGDGNYSSTHVSLSVSDLQVDAFVCEQAERMGLTARRKTDARTDKVWYRTFVRPAPWKGNALRNPLHTLLREQGMWGKSGHTKRVPPMVWAAGEKGRAAFLSGYFDADGHATRTAGMKLSSVNRALLDDCQVLFESLGIRAQVHSYEYQYASHKNSSRPQPLHVLTVSHTHNFGLLRDALSPIVSTKLAALDDMARPAGQGAKKFAPVEWDGVKTVAFIGGGDIVTLGISETHTHVTAGLVSHNTLNLRDEAQERQFIAQLKQMGVPVSDGSLAVNIPIEFDQELQKQAEETVAKGLAKAQAMDKLQKVCDAQGIPYPDDLVAALSATLQLRQGLAQTEMVEGQAEMQEQQLKAMTPAGQMGLLPGVSPPPPDPEAQGQQKAAASTGPHGSPPSASGPGGVPETDQQETPPELPRNRQRPAESDEQRGSMPKKSKFEQGPSSYGKARRADSSRVERAVRRREAVARGVSVSDLVNDPESYALTNMGGYEAQIRADWPEIQAGGAPDSRKLLEELVEQYEEVTGITPRWD